MWSEGFSSPKVVLSLVVALGLVAAGCTSEADSGANSKEDGASKNASAETAGDEKNSPPSQWAGSYKLLREEMVKRSLEARIVKAHEGQQGDWEAQFEALSEVEKERVMADAEESLPDMNATLVLAKDGTFEMTMTLGDVPPETTTGQWRQGESSVTLVIPIPDGGEMTSRFVAEGEFFILQDGSPPYVFAKS